MSTTISAHHLSDPQIFKSPAAYVGDAPTGFTTVSRPNWCVTCEELTARLRQLPAGNSATLEFTVVGNTVTIAQVFVDPSGHEVGGRMTIRADGSERPSEYGNGML
jgi:hypothetical protein